MQAGPVSQIVEELHQVRARALPATLLKLQTVTGVFVVPDSLTSRSAFAMSGLCQAPSPAPVV